MAKKKLEPVAGEPKSKRIGPPTVPDELKLTELLIARFSKSEKDDLVDLSMHMHERSLASTIRMCVREAVKLMKSTRGNDEKAAGNHGNRHGSQGSISGIGGGF